MDHPFGLPPNPMDGGRRLSTCKERASLGSSEESIQLGATPMNKVNGGPLTEEVLLGILTQERERTGALMAEWMDQHKKLYEEHLTQQERLMQGLLDIHRTTLQELLPRLGAPSAPGHGFAAPAVSVQHGDDVITVPEDSALPDEDTAPPPVRTSRLEPPGARVQESRETSRDNSKGFAPDYDAEIEALQRNDAILNLWKRTSGLHTVDSWVSDYHNHPAGWTALLMIHGIPEVTGRMRSKVESYAIYSALFLSMSISLLTEKPDYVETLCPEDSSSIEWWTCHIQMRAYFWGFGVGTAAHMLCILLAMSFVNALNEAARDSDVYRMFARGRGFHATLKCQYAFRVGCLADLLAVTTAASYHLGWEAILGGCALLVLVLVKLHQTANPLFRNASIVHYWREELGGKPDKDDPYDLQTPVGVFRSSVNHNSRFSLHRPKVPPGRPSWLQIPMPRRSSIISSSTAPHGGSPPQHSGRPSFVDQQTRATTVAAIF